VIKYRVICEQAHGFDAWFASSDTFDEQVGRGHVACPHCGSANVGRALMTPALRTSRRRAAVAGAAPPPDEIPAEAEPRAPASPGGSPAPAGSGARPQPAPRAEDPVRMAKLEAMHQALAEAMRTVREYVTAHGVDVGRDFAEQARKIHYGEADPRGIYGEATTEEARELLEEGIDVLPLPRLPEDGN